MRHPPLTPPTLLRSALAHFYPVRLLRKTGYRLRPPNPIPFAPSVRYRQDALLATGTVRWDQKATVRFEKRKGTTPTIVLGGFVPDATEQVLLLRGFLLGKGSVYYFAYPRSGFSAALLFAQLDDLVEELSLRCGQPPVVLAVSFGAGLLLEWLKRKRTHGQRADLAGLVLVSPVGCVQDLIEPGAAKPSTLLGRALFPFLQAQRPVDPAAQARARGIFVKMFEAGAQNTSQLASLMTARELGFLKEAVMQSVHGVDGTGACERVRALAEMAPLNPWSDATLSPLSDAPTLVLFAEKESSVLVESSPTRAQLERTPCSFFPQSECHVVRSHRGSPVQHASLIFHGFDFLPALARFYRTLKARSQPRAA